MQRLFEISQEEKNIHRWVVFDGPIDPLWVENLNTVLDDNMLLCLASGERIKLRNEMKMIFNDDKKSFSLGPP